MHKGEVDEWDMSLLCNVILYSTIFQGAEIRSERNAVMKIRNLRNEISHSITPSLSEEKYKTTFNDIVAHLKALGADIDLDADGDDIESVSHKIHFAFLCSFLCIDHSWFRAYVYFLCSALSLVSLC